jgi:transcriptional regulator with XRE-family HTH domain
MESTIGQRIRQLREAKQLSVADFAKAAGVKPSAIYGLESDANKPSIETVGALRTAFPDLNTEWLQFGSGDMFKDGRGLTSAAQLPQALPVMGVNLELDEMTDAQRADFYKLYYERTKQKLAVAEQTIAQLTEAQEHAEVVQLVARAGGRSGFNDASADAAEDDHTPPFMVAETNHEYVPLEEQVRRVGFKYGVSLS